MHGQYVIYYNERLSWRICHDKNRCQYAYNDLCELEVYGMYFKILLIFFDWLNNYFHYSTLAIILTVKKITRNKHAIWTRNTVFGVFFFKMLFVCT